MKRCLLRKYFSKLHFCIKTNRSFDTKSLGNFISSANLFTFFLLIWPAFSSASPKLQFGCMFLNTSTVNGGLSNEAVLFAENSAQSSFGCNVRRAQMARQTILQLETLRSWRLILNSTEKAIR